MFEIRCDGIRRSGYTKGQPCNYLLFRYQPDLRGVVETKCVSCNKLRQWVFHGALIGATT